MRHGIFTECESNPTEIDDQVVSKSSAEISLRELFPSARFFAADDIQFESLAASPAGCQTGELVVYRIGHDDPMRVVADALARGAAGILTEQLLPCPLPQCIVGDTEIALAKIAAQQLDRPDRKMLTIGVIGSAGKTTTSLLISSLLRSCGYRAAYQTDLGQSDGIVQDTPKIEIPTHSSLVHWMREAVDAESQAAIIEMSDQATRHGNYDAIEFDILVIVGSGTTKTDFGPTAIQCGLDRLSDDGVVIAAADDQQTLTLIRDAEARVVTYSARRAADVTAKIFDQSGGMTTLMVTHQNTTAMMETPLCGAANAANHLAATIVGLLLGHPIQQIVEHLGELRQIPGRGQRLVEFGQPTVVIDVGGSTERVADALRTHRSMKGGGRLWCVLAVDASDSPEALARYGTLLEKFADQPIVTARADGKSSFMATSHAVLDGVEKCAVMRLVADRRRAIDWAVSESNAGDTILIITGEKQTTAHEQRSDIHRITEWVNNGRPETAVDEPVKLKIFPQV